MHLTRSKHEFGKAYISIRGYTYRRYTPTSYLFEIESVKLDIQGTGHVTFPYDSCSGDKEGGGGGRQFHAWP